MPANKSLYPPDWLQIARRIKEAADWKCKQCGKQCYRPDEPCTDRSQILTVHHIDHSPSNCQANNLIALCAPCHLRADALHHARNAKRTWARKRGQMYLPSMEEI